MSNSNQLISEMLKSNPLLRGDRNKKFADFKITCCTCGGHADLIVSLRSLPLPDRGGFEGSVYFVCTECGEWQHFYGDRQNTREDIRRRSEKGMATK